MHTLHSDVPIGPQILYIHTNYERSNACSFDRSLNLRFPACISIVTWLCSSLIPGCISYNNTNVRG
ncbi:hypothetical protein DL93DRAFT_1321983 [Clavulina sp. PMI_390]|nr:hypothetical protein DL93DRAFT_1321983 [Clavulina sp. PMI_390]